MRLSAGAYFFLTVLAVLCLLEEANFLAAGMAVFFSAALTNLDFDGTAEADFGSPEAFGFAVGFATVFAADAAGFDDGFDFPDNVAALEGTTGFKGATGLAGIAADDFLPASTFSDLETSLGAGGLFGFFFGGSCSSAQRSMTSAMVCSVSA